MGECREYPFLLTDKLHQESSFRTSAGPAETPQSHSRGIVFDPWLVKEDPMCRVLQPKKVRFFFLQKGSFSGTSGPLVSFRAGPQARF